MPNFNVGDRILCNRGGRTPNGNEVIEGRIYVVVGTGIAGSVRLEGVGRTMWLDNRFELVAPPVVAEVPRETSVRYVVIDHWGSWWLYEDQEDAQNFADDQAGEGDPVKAMKKVTLTLNAGA